MKTRRLAFAAVILALGAASWPGEAATVACGSVLRGKARLTGDLDCTGKGPITLVDGRAHLDLNGHTLRCGSSGTQNPLRLRGRGALLRNGSLSECTVELLEGGDHKVRNVEIDTFDFVGLTISSNSNEVVFSRIETDGVGMRVLSGNYNLITDNYIFGDGLALEIQNRTIVVNNQLAAFSGGGLGLNVVGNLNRVLGNELIEVCISVGDGVGNIIEGNPEDPEFCD